MSAVHIKNAATDPAPLCGDGSASTFTTPAAAREMATCDKCNEVLHAAQRQTVRELIDSGQTEFAITTPPPVFKQVDFPLGRMMPR